MNRYLVMVLAMSIGLTAGCPEQRTNAVSSVQDVNRVLNNSRLDAQEKRDALAELGLSSDVIDALLRDQRTANQGGGSLRSAFNKVRRGRLDTLTPDEVQLYGDGASDVDQALDVTFNDDAASNIAALFQTNDIRTSEDLTDYLAVPGNVVSLPSGVSEADLKAVFVTFDPDQLIPELP